MRPNEGFYRQGISRSQVILGALGSVLVHALILVAFSAYANVASPRHPRLEHALKKQPEEHVIAAELLTLGEALDPGRLPDRSAPQAATSQANPEKMISKRRAKRRSPDAKSRQIDSVEDALTKLGNRAEVFDSLERQREIEGAEIGIQEGTTTETTAQNEYYTRLYAFFRRGLVWPATLSRAQLSRLNLPVAVRIRPDLSFEYTFSGSSGNDDFDTAVRQQMQRLSGLRLPPPALEIEELAFSNSYRINFTGRLGLSAERSTDRSEATSPSAPAEEPPTPPSEPPPREPSPTEPPPREPSPTESSSDSIQADPSPTAPTSNPASQSI
ncbi:MAG: TonB C-terminal domain-containing protein [Myxococcota bacterium]